MKEATSKYGKALFKPSQTTLPTERNKEMTIATYCGATGKHLGMEELEQLSYVQPTARKEIHSMYCPYCGKK